MAPSDSSSESVSETEDRSSRGRRPTRSSQRGGEVEVDTSAWLAPREAPQVGRDGKYHRPAGRAPVHGYEWSARRGVWVPGKRLLAEMALSHQHAVRKRRAHGSKRSSSATALGEEEASVAGTNKPRKKRRRRKSSPPSVPSDIDSSEAPSVGRRTTRPKQRAALPPPAAAAAVQQNDFTVGADDAASLPWRKRLKSPPGAVPFQQTQVAHPQAEVADDPFHPGSQWQEPKPGPLESELTLYEKHRKPRPAPSGSFKCPLQGLQQEFRCVICLDYIRNARIVRECLHRFCENCIEKSLVQVGLRKECPICRVHIPSRRSLAPDPDFDKLIRYIVRDNPSVEDGREEEAPLNPVSTQASRILQRAIRKRLSRNTDDDSEDCTSSSNSDVDEDGEDDEEEEETKTDTTATQRFGLQENTLVAAAPKAPPALIKVVLMRARKERTILDDLELPFLTISDDAPVSVLEQFLRQKHGFRFSHIVILLYHNHFNLPSPLVVPSSMTLRNFVTTHSSLLTENAEGYLPLYYKSIRWREAT